MKRLNYSKRSPVLRTVFFTFFIFLFFTKAAHCLSDIQLMKASFLDGNYKKAAYQAENIINSQSYLAYHDEVYYILGEIYLKVGDYDKARLNFKTVINNYKKSKFYQHSLIGIGDAYLLQDDFEKAKIAYDEIIKEDFQINLKPQIFYRLYLIGIKTANQQLASEYKKRIESEFPKSPEVKLLSDNNQIVLSSSGSIYYTIQLGCFSNYSNAKNLMQELKGKGYPVYIEENPAGGGTLYRVRAGKLDKKEAALELEKELKHQGYPTKIFP